MINGRKFEIIINRRDLAIRKVVLECQRDSRLANVKFECNMTSGSAIGGQKTDDFFLSREDRMHQE